MEKGESGVKLYVEVGSLEFGGSQEEKVRSFSEQAKIGRDKRGMINKPGYKPIETRGPVSRQSVEKIDC